MPIRGGQFRDGGAKLQHRAVTITVAQGVREILEANPRRLRVLMYNSAAAGSTVYVGDSVDVNGNALAETNGWPLTEDRIVALNADHQKLLANILELFTQDAVYGRAYVGTGVIRMIEELTE